MEVYVVKGENNSRKSSLIRALTSVGTRRKVLRIAMDREGGILRKDIYVQDSSPQDLKIPQSPGMLMDAILKSGVDTCLIALRNERCQAMPGGDDYLHAFESRAWNVVRTVNMEAVAQPPGEKGFETSYYGDAMTIRFHKDVATGELAEEVRKFFGWR